MEHQLLLHVGPNGVPFDLKLALLPGCLEEERSPQEVAAGFQPTLRLWRQIPVSLATSLARPDWAQDCQISLSRRSCNRSSNSRPQVRLEGKERPLAAMRHRSSTVKKLTSAPPRISMDRDALVGTRWRWSISCWARRAGGFLVLVLQHLEDLSASWEKSSEKMGALVTR